MRPDPHRPRILTEAEPLPVEVTDAIAEQAITTYEQLTRPGHPAGEVLWPPVEDPDAVDRAAARATAAFEQTASARDWTVPRERVRGLAADAIGLYVEGYAYDYDRERAHAAAVLECLQGEAARAEVYQPPPEPEIQAPPTPAPSARVERARAGGER
jgi:hypothetical protein